MGTQQSTQHPPKQNREQQTAKPVFVQKQLPQIPIAVPQSKSFKLHVSGTSKQQLMHFAKQLQQEFALQEQTSEWYLGDENLGGVLAFVMVQRPQHVQVDIFPACNDTISIQFASNTSTEYDSHAQCKNVAKDVRIFHLHCHMTVETELVALALHKALLEYMDKLELDCVRHRRVWHGKNGPHNKWSWEIHVATVQRLEDAVLFLAVIGTVIQGLHFPFHCRTYDYDDHKNEYYDHALRLGWIGPPDTSNTFDINFFKH